MPRFFFNLRHGGRIIEDRDGAELPDRASARREALTSVGHEMVDMSEELCEKLVMEVSQDGSVFYSLEVKAANAPIAD